MVNAPMSHEAQEALHALSALAADPGNDSIRARAARAEDRCGPLEWQAAVHALTAKAIAVLRGEERY